MYTFQSRSPLSVDRDIFRFSSLSYFHEFVQEKINIRIFFSRPNRVLSYRVSNQCFFLIRSIFVIIYIHIYIYIRDIRLQTHQWSENTIRTVVRPYWQVHGGYVERSIQMIVTPRVRAEVQAHFNCPELEGAELEDQGEDGTALTHWEKRVFEVNRYKYRYDNDRNDRP